MQKLNKKDFFSFLQKVPKAELHIHLEAVITLESVKKLYKKRFNCSMPKEQEKKLFEYNNLQGFIDAFLKVQDLFSELSDFDLVFDDFADYLTENGIPYCEAFFAPSAFLKKGFEYKDMVEVFSKNIEKIKKERGITIKLLMDVSRTFGLVNAQTNYDLFKSVPSEHIIGIGLGGSEDKGPCRLFAPVFSQAHKDGFHAVCHAGEDCDFDSVRDAIKILNAERIGHGITSIQNQELLDELKEKQIPLEVCPTSNIFTKHYVKSMEEHPIRTLFDKGILVTVNTDDPVFFKTTLLNEFYELYTKTNFSLDEIHTLIKNSFNASFLDKKQKQKYLKECDKCWTEFLPK